MRIDSTGSELRNGMAASSSFGTNPIAGRVSSSCCQRRSPNRNGRTRQADRRPRGRSSQLGHPRTRALPSGAAAAVIAPPRRHAFESVSLNSMSDSSAASAQALNRSRCSTAEADRKCCASTAYICEHDLALLHRLSRMRRAIRGAVGSCSVEDDALLRTMPPLQAPDTWALVWR